MIREDKSHLVDLVAKAMKKQSDDLKQQDVILDIHVERLTKQRGQLKKAREALEYLRSPTMGHDASCSPEEFAEKHATDENVRLALATCIRIAQQAAEALDDKTTK